MPSTPDLELLLILFSDPRQADLALRELRKMEKGDQIKFIDAAAVLKDLSGKTDFSEAHDLEAWQGSIFGAISGALLGLLGGPIGAVLGGVAGAAAGGAVAGGVDLGFSDDLLKDLQEALKPGTSALLVLLEPPWDGLLVRTSEAWEGRLFRHLLQSDVVQRLKQALEQAG